jgi:hypothetical protein
VTLSGSLVSASDVQYPNAEYSMVVTLSGSLVSASDSHPLNDAQVVQYLVQVRSVYPGKAKALFV